VHDRRVTGRWLGGARRAVDVVLPPAVALFLLTALSDRSFSHSGTLTLCLGVPAAMIQGAALLAALPAGAGDDRSVLGGLALQVVAPELVIPFAGLVAICALAAARPPAVSVPALVALVGLAAANFRMSPAGDVVSPWAHPVSEEVSGVDEAGGAGVRQHVRIAEGPDRCPERAILAGCRVNVAGTRLSVHGAARTMASAMPPRGGWGGWGCRCAGRRRSSSCTIRWLSR